MEGFFKFNKKFIHCMNLPQSMNIKLSPTFFSGQFLKKPVIPSIPSILPLGTIHKPSIKPSIKPVTNPPFLALVAVLPRI